MQFGRPPLAQVLLQEGLVTEDQIQVANEDRKRHHLPLGETLVRLKFLHPFDLQQALAKITGLPVVDLRVSPSCPQAIELLPKDVWLNFHAVVFSVEGQHIHVALRDPENVETVDRMGAELFQRHGHFFTHTLYHADPVQIETYIHKVFGDSHKPELTPNHNALDVVENILNQGVKVGASDIHFQPEEQSLRIRLRCDGILHTLQTVHQDIWPHMVVCLKVMAGLDIGETRRPQGGGFQRLMGGHHVDFRVGTHPTVYGESIVVRVLDKDKSPLRIHQLGFQESHILLFQKLIQQPQGMVIFSGPTGSGKTTTLYSLFAEMDREARNIVTLEQPVEYHLHGVRQTEIRDGVISFQEGLRSILRQDPDVIFIGEIRDEETARMALRSAMTGHLVFATLHTNDAASVPARLMDLGLPPTLLSGNILAVVAQRLLRVICSECGQHNTPKKGCDSCFQTGYKGRVAVAEILPFDGALNHMVATGATISELRACAHKKGIQTLKDDAYNKQQQGITTHEEIRRVLGDLAEPMIITP
jgi:type IV pilus assembly protein PilB